MGAIEASAPNLIRTCAAGVLETALVKPARPQTVAFDVPVNTLTRQVTNKSKALDEPAVLSALDVGQRAELALRDGAHAVDHRLRSTQWT